MVPDFMKYRDSFVWVLGVIAAVIVGLATLDTQTAVESFGIPAAALPYLRLAAFIVGIVSAQLGWSPLKKRPTDPQP